MHRLGCRFDPKAILTAMADLRHGADAAHRRPGTHQLWRAPMRRTAVPILSALLIAG